MTDPGRGALSGITVLDLSAYIAGPYGCTLLADLGARVIKVEPPGGDTLRQYPSTLTTESRAFLGCNRSKLGISLDLKKTEGLTALLRLAATADVLVRNFRPAVPPRLGIAYGQIRELNPRLIYCAVTGYGEDGPLKDKAGYDQVLQSMTGMCVFQGGTDDPEIVYGSPVDYYAASMLAYGVTAALFHRERTGEGQFVGVSLLRTALAMQSARFIWAEGEPRETGRDMRSGGITGIHPTREGRLYISANTPHFWSALCDLTGLTALARDPRYETVRKRAERASDLIPQLHRALAAKTAREWEETFGEKVPCCAVRPIEEMFEHPQVLAEQMVSSLAHPGVGSYRGFSRPVKLSASPGPDPFAAPVFGQHTEAVLEEAGYSAADIRALRDAGVIP